MEVALAEQLSDMNERLTDNDKVLKDNSRWMKLALGSAIGTLIIGCFIGVLIVATK